MQHLSGWRDAGEWDFLRYLQSVGDPDNMNASRDLSSVSHRQGL